jgi:putative transcriptional regulator
VTPLRRIFLGLELLLLTLALPAAAVRPGSDVHHTSLTGQLLVATPQMEDPRFRETVILIVKHDKDGALGITINRPLGTYPLAYLLEGFGEKNVTADRNLEVFSGGPVRREAAFVIHTTEYSRPETIPINEYLAATSTKEIFHDIGQNKGPKKTLVAFGYAGWGPNQLEAELARDDWFTAEADLALIFDEKRERVWDRAMERRLRDL